MNDGAGPANHLPEAEPTSKVLAYEPPGGDIEFIRLANSFTVLIPPTGFFAQMDWLSIASMCIPLLALLPTPTYSNILIQHTSLTIWLVTLLLAVAFMSWISLRRGRQRTEVQVNCGRLTVLTRGPNVYKFFTHRLADLAKPDHYFWTRRHVRLTLRNQWFGGVTLTCREPHQAKWLYELLRIAIADHRVTPPSPVVAHPR